MPTNKRGAGVPPALFRQNGSRDGRPTAQIRLARRADMPDIVIASRQRVIRYDHDRLVLLVENAMPLCMEVAAKLRGPLVDLRQVECSVVGRRTMARVHREFLDIRGATDVITFPYGEILVCAPVAELRAREFGHDVTTELALYCIHGLLHLAGHDDVAPDSARLMTRAQMRILDTVSRLNPRGHP